MYTLIVIYPNNIISNCSLSDVIEFSKELHCPREIITVSVTTGTILSSPQATDNFIMYKPSLLPIGRTDCRRKCREAKGTNKKAKSPSRILAMKDGTISRGDFTSSIPSRCPSLPIIVRDYVQRNGNIRLRAKRCVCHSMININEKSKFKLKIDCIFFCVHHYY